MTRASRDGRMPAIGADLLRGSLVTVSTDVIPLYAALTLVHTSLAGQPATTCVPTCMILAQALTLLGFDAEPMAAFAQVWAPQHPGDGVWELGTWPQPPIVRPDLTTNGHMVLWASSFDRLIDPTIAQIPVLLHEAVAQPQLAFPAVLPIASRATLLATRPSVQRGPYQIAWQLAPEWTYLIEPVMSGDRAAAGNYGAINLAHQTLQLIQSLGPVRKDLQDSYDRWPHLQSLAAGFQELPPLPAITPAAATLLGIEPTQNV